MSEQRVAALLGGAVALVAFVVMLWTFGTPGRAAQQSPDEANTARGTELVAQHGRPVAPAPVPADTDGIRQRMWVTVDEDAHAPASPVATMMIYGIPAAVVGGEWVRYLLPAAGLGAWVAAVALFLPRRRQWVAALWPGLAFPATYWLLRPWHNASLEFALVGFGFLLLVLRQRGWHRGWAMVAVGAMTLASLVRPDHVHLLFGLSAVGLWLSEGGRSSLAAGPWQRVLGWHAAAAAAWFAGVIGLNLLTTGQPFVTTVDLLDFPAAAQLTGADLPAPLRAVAYIVAPNGIPGPGLVVRQLGKYWLRFGPILPVLILAAGGTSVLWRQRRDLRPALAVTLVLCAGFALSRISDSDLGATAGNAALVHSYPRYNVVVYGIVAVLAVVALATIRRLRPVVLMGGAAAALIGLGGLFVPAADGEGFAWLRTTLDDASALADALDKQIPRDAVVFTQRADKYLWDVRPVAKLQVERPLPGAGPVDTDLASDAILAADREGRCPIVLETTEEELTAVSAVIASAGLRFEPRALELPAVEGIPTHLPALYVVGGGACPPGDRP